MKNKIYFWFEQGVPRWQTIVAQEAVEHILSRLGLRRYFHTFIVPDDSNAHESFGSMQWYKDRIIVIGPNKLAYNAQRLLTEIQYPTGSNSSYHVFVFEKMICGNGGGVVAGLATNGVGGIISNYAFRNFPERVCREWFRTLCFHEIGHMFGLPRKSRLINLSFSKHCSNVCVMRDGTTSHHAWKDLTSQRERINQVYCLDCLRDLEDFKESFLKTAGG